MSRTYKIVWDGVDKFMIGDPRTDGIMPGSSEMHEAAEVYGGGVTFKGEKPSKKQHFVEGRAIAKHVQMKAGAKEGTFQIWVDNLDKFAELVGGEVTSMSGKAKFKSSANYTGVIKAISFRSTASGGEAPVTLDFPKVSLFVAENFVMNDESVWLGDVSFEPLAPYEIDGVPVVE